MDIVNFTQDDRKLIIQLNTDLKLLQQTVTSLNENVKELNNKLNGDVFMKKIDAMEIDKDHETRLRRLEMWGGISIGAIFILELVFQFLIK